MYTELPVVLTDFLIYMETIRAKSKNTVKEYLYDLRIFLRFMKVHKNSPFLLHQKDFDINDINISDVDISLIRSIILSDLYNYMSYVSKFRDNSPSSRARKVASIKSFFKYLKNKAKLLDSNPSVELESPKVLKHLPRYLNIDESRSLLSCIEGDFKERDFAIITLFLNCGLRLSELVGINITNIKNDTITILGKGNKERTVYLNEACFNAIETYLKIRSKNALKDRDALFLSKRKQRISKKTVQHLVKKYIKLSGLDPARYSTHKLRHTAATLMYKYGNVDIRALQEILGHENISTTEIYTHVDSKQLRNATMSNPLSGFIKKSEG